MNTRDIRTTANTLCRLTNEVNSPEFHKYWNEHHQEILNLAIDEAACKKVAAALHDVYARTGGRAFKEVYDTAGLSKENICRVRMLTANQDFRGSRKFGDLAKVFIDDDSLFDEHEIVKDPEGFIKDIGITDLSQNDKRVQYAKNISQFLIDHKSSPFDIIDKFDRDLYTLRSAMIAYDGAGYGNKKTDMFLRDMVVLGVWDNVTGFDKIDVASDVNTVKVALRTGVLKSEIPLLSSFLDIFCVQYGHVDAMTAKAWRRVWEIWRADHPEDSIESPCLLDYFIYNVVGKQFCKENLYILSCEAAPHTFKWHASKRSCQICYKTSKRREKTHVVRKVMACTDEEGKIAIAQTPFYKSGIATPNFEECPFKAICDESGSRKLMSPKSISIMGKTGWTTAYTDSSAGSGGLMA